MDRVSKKGGKRAIGLGFLKDRATTSFTQTIYSSVAMQAIQKRQDLKNLCDKKKTQVRLVREPGTLGGKEGIPELGKAQLEAGAPQSSRPAFGAGEQKEQEEEGKT